MYIKQILKSLFFGILIISSSNLFGMNDTETINNQSFKPQYSKHLKKILSHSLWTTAHLAAFALIYSKSTSIHNVVALDYPFQIPATNEIKWKKACNGLSWNAIKYSSLIFGYKALENIHDVIKHAILLGNEAWKSHTNFGILDPQEKSSDKSFEPKYEQHLKKSTSHAFWGTLELLLATFLCTEFYNSHAQHQAILALHIMILGLKNEYHFLKNSILLGNEGWKAVTGYGQKPHDPTNSNQNEEVI